MIKHPVALLVVCSDRPAQLAQLSALTGIADITVVEGEQGLAEAAARAEAMLMWAGGPESLRTVLRNAPKLRWIHSKNAGIESLLIPELQEADVILTNARGVYARSLAEFALAGMLYFAKDMPRMLRNKTVCRWEQFSVEELAGRTLGIYGYGAIGASIAKKAKAFDMRVIGLRRNPRKSANDAHADQILPFDQIDELVTQCDYLAVAAPSTAETAGAIGVAQFNRMKPNCVVINVGRGKVIDENALIDALRSGRIRGAALDVFAEEPLPHTSPLWEMESVFISPHTADQTETWLDESMALFVENMRRYTGGRELLNICDKELGY